MDGTQNGESDQARLMRQIDLRRVSVQDPDVVLIDWANNRADSADVRELIGMLERRSRCCGVRQPRGNSFVTELVLNQNPELGNDAIEPLFTRESAGGVFALEQIRLDGTRVGPEMMDRILARKINRRLGPHLDAIKANDKNMVKLDWSKSADDVDGLAPTMSKLGHTTSINGEVTDDMVGKLVKALQEHQNTNLRTINLTNSDNVTDEHMGALGDLIGPGRRGCCGGSSSSGITEVLLDGTKVSSDVAASLKHKIDMRRVQDWDQDTLDWSASTVDWSASSVDDDAIKDLANVMDTKGCLVTEVILSNNPDVKDCVPLIDLVKNPERKLQTVALDGTSVGAEAEKAMRAAMLMRELKVDLKQIEANSRTPSRVQWSDKHIHGEHIEMLCKSLEYNSHVTTIDLQNNADLKDEDLLDLIEVVSHRGTRRKKLCCFPIPWCCAKMSSVGSVALEGTGATPAAIATVSRSIDMRNVKLESRACTELDWSDGSVTSDEVRDLVTLMDRSSCRVTSVDLSNNRAIKDLAATGLMPALKKEDKRSLVEVKVENTSLSDGDKDLIADATRARRLKPTLHAVKTSTLDSDTLDWSWETVQANESDIDRLLDCLEHNHNLKEINLQGNPLMTAAQMDRLAELVGPGGGRGRGHCGLGCCRKTMSSVERVNVDGTEASSRARFIIRRSIDLRSLLPLTADAGLIDWSMFDGTVINADVQDLVQALRHSTCSPCSSSSRRIQVLNLSNNPEISDESVQQLLRSRSKSYRVGRLHAAGTQVKQDLIDKFADTERSSGLHPDLLKLSADKLTELNWDGVKLSNDNIADLLEVIPKSTKLREISLQQNPHVTDQHMEELGKLVGPDGRRVGSCGSAFAGRCGVQSVLLDGTGVSEPMKAWIRRQIDLRFVSERSLTRTEINWNAPPSGDAVNKAGQDEHKDASEPEPELDVEASAEPGSSSGIECGGFDEGVPSVSFGVAQDLELVSQPTLGGGVSFNDGISDKRISQDVHRLIALISNRSRMASCCSFGKDYTSHVSTISLRGHRMIDGAHGQELQQLLQQRGSVTSVVLDGTRVTENQQKQVHNAVVAKSLQPDLDSVKSNSQSTLDWSGKDVADVHIEKLLEALKSNTSLKTLVLTANVGITDAHMHDLADLLGPFPRESSCSCLGCCSWRSSIDEVQLAGTSVSGVTVANLRRQIELRRMLSDKSFDRLDWAVDEEDGGASIQQLEDLITCLRKAKQVLEVDLTHNKRFTQAESLELLLDDGKHALERLILMGTGVSAKSLDTINAKQRKKRLKPDLKDIKKNSIRALNWDGSGVTNDDLQELIQNLREGDINTALKTINLSHNYDLTDAHMADLALAIGKESIKKTTITSAISSCGVEHVQLVGVTTVSAESKARLAHSINLRTLARFDARERYVDWSDGLASGTDIEELAAILKEPECLLEHLNLSNSGMLNHVHGMLLEEALRWRGNNVDEIAKEGGKLVRTVNLENTSMGEVTIKAIEAAQEYVRTKERKKRLEPDLRDIKQNSTRDLNWDNTDGAMGVTDDDLQELIQNLREGDLNTALKTINLSHNYDLTDTHMADLALAIGKESIKKTTITSAISSCGVEHVQLVGVTTVSAESKARLAHSINLRTLARFDARERYVDWSDGLASGTDIEELAAILKEPECLLEHLNLSNSGMLNHVHGMLLEEALRWRGNNVDEIAKEGGKLVRTVNLENTSMGEVTIKAIEAAQEYVRTKERARRLRSDLDHVRNNDGSNIPGNRTSPELNWSKTPDDPYSGASVEDVEQLLEALRTASDRITLPLRGQSTEGNDKVQRIRLDGNLDVTDGAVDTLIEVLGPSGPRTDGTPDGTLICQVREVTLEGTSVSVPKQQELRRAIDLRRIEQDDRDLIDLIWRGMDLDRCETLSTALSRNQHVRTVDLSNNPRLKMDDENDGPGLIRAVQQIQSRVESVVLNGTPQRKAIERERVYEDSAPDYKTEKVCDKSSFEDELNRSITVRRVRNGDPRLTEIQWAGQGIGDNDGLNRQKDPALNLLKALQDNPGGHNVQYVDVSNNPKLTSHSIKKLEGLGLPGQQKQHTAGCGRKVKRGEDLL